MSQLHRYVQGDYKLFSGFTLSHTQCGEIASIITSPQHLVASDVLLGVGHGLRGRSALCGGVVTGIGEVILKTYRRGGFLKKFLHSRYLRMGQSRSRSEFKILQRVRALGVNAPEPIAYVEQGEMWYRAWLVTKRIPSDESFIDLCLHQPERAIAIGHIVAQQIGLLIQNRIHHVDLHPGNIVIDTTGSVHIVDFDKAYVYAGKRNELRDQYLRRWRRAVIKHGLPELLCEAVSLDLRGNYDDE